MLTEVIADHDAPLGRPLLGAAQVRVSLVADDPALAAVEHPPAIRVPFLAIVLTTVLVILLNRVLASYAIPRMTLPLAPLSLQASSIGLLLVFLNTRPTTASRRRSAPWADSARSAARSCSCSW